MTVLPFTAIDAPGTLGLEPDAHGQAALLLAESMLHALVEQRLISVDEAIATVRSAAEVKEERAQAEGESKKRMEASLVLLEQIAGSFMSNVSWKHEPGFPV